jgi:Fe-S-cluster containining protein
MAGEDELVAHVKLKVAGEPVHARFVVPKGPAGPRQLLPLAQQTADLVVGVAERAEERQGRTISCAAGCGACCRQLVPIAPSEARHLAALVEELPEPRRSQIRERFAAAVRRLSQTEWMDTLRHPERLADEQTTPLGLAYFRLGIPCPFLEQESCSIHPHRPIACREHLVTSPPVHCAEQTPKQVRGVALPVRVSRVLRHMDQRQDGSAPPWIPLVLALEWVANHPEEPPPRSGPQWLEEFIACLTGGTR